MGEKLNSFFEQYMQKESIFKEKSVLLSAYTPDIIPHRDSEVEKVASILAPALKLEKPSNLFIYGTTGTGKTVVTNYVTSKMEEITQKSNNNLKIYRINCKLKKVADTEYRLMADVARTVFNEQIPETGLSTNEVYKIFVNALDKEKVLLLMVLDEIDSLVEKTGDEILYNLTRLNSELKNSQLSIIGISNKLDFTDHMDARVKSSLTEEEIQFFKYNAVQILDILKERAGVAFKEGKIQEGLLEKCAAYAATHGDARRAIDLLRVSAEISERKNENLITIESLDEADEKLDTDKYFDAVKNMNKQNMMVLFSLFELCSKDNSKPVLSGNAYDGYKNLCLNLKNKVLTQRRFSDILGELELLGILHTKLVSHGRYGRTRHLGLGIPPSTAPKIERLLREGLGL
ncbi:MAG: AAA family ATPase [Candidatus Nanoarchaeia archaeon]|nr:AAA family ATPase [Candidatus Nanoarchaeia archaeon]